MSGAGSKHLDLEPRCGACGDVVFEHERVIALFGNADPSTNGYLSYTKRFPYPYAQYTGAKVDNVQLCTRPGCGVSQLPGMQHSTPEAVTVHNECFSIFIQECTRTLTEIQAEERLFTTGLYRNPWPRAQPLSLTDGYYMSRTSLEKIAYMSGLPQLAVHPAELVEMVRQFSPHSLFWRAISVIALAERLSTTPSSPLLVVPIYEIDRWERGGELERWIPPHDLPSTSSKLNDLSLDVPISSRRAVVRLTIDAEGIQKIELLSDRPPYVRERTESVAYMVEELAALKGVKVCFKDGLVQLYSKAGYPSLRIWDTPAPPSLSQCTIYSDKKRPWRHFRTVELDSITGLTFFYCRGTLLGIHPHRINDQCAMSSCERLSKRFPVAWIYYPIVPKDQILIFGARPSEVGVNILIRSCISGDTVIGAWARGTAADTWRRKEPTTLIYGEPPFGSAIPYLGTYCRALPNKQLQPEPHSPSSRSSSSTSGFVTSSPERPNPRARHKVDKPFIAISGNIPNHPVSRESLLYYSVAPLNDVISAQVFYSSLPRPSDTDPGEELQEFQTTACEGVMLHYRNGVVRTLGQIRLHVDACKTIANPTHTCIMYPHEVLLGDSAKLDRAWLRFVSDPEHVCELRHTRARCRALSECGPLRWWFNERNSHIGIIYNADI